MQKKQQPKNNTYSSYIDGSFESRCALLFGGAGYEHSVSLASAAGFLALLPSGVPMPLLVYISRSGEFFIYSGDADRIADISPEASADLLLPTYPVRLFGSGGFFVNGEVLPIKRALVLMHGDYGEDGRIQAALELAGIEHSGADSISSALMADKAFSLAVARSVCVPTLDYLSFDLDLSLDLDSLIYGRVIPRAEESIGYPVFVKPCRLGSSFGAGGAENRTELYRAIRRAFAYADRIMLQPMLKDKREIECAYFGTASGEITVSYPGEVLVGGFYGYDEKYGNNDIKITPRADIDSSVAEEVMRYTRLLAAEMGARGCARFDYFLVGEKIYFNEVNSIPGMTERSLYPSMLAESGVSPERFSSELLYGGAL